MVMRRLLRFLLDPSLVAGKVLGLESESWSAPRTGEGVLRAESEAVFSGDEGASPDRNGNTKSGHGVEACVAPRSCWGICRICPDLFLWPFFE